MEKTKEERATVTEFVGVLQELLRENVVGWIEQNDEEFFSFCLAGGKRFLVHVTEE
ncbi:MAG: hypothetical protein J6S04_05560 [Clostridia bacterium]|nr:hypothetical protein [Clostridia bacterium]